MADELALTPAEGVSVVWDRAAVAALGHGESDDAPAWRLEGALAPRFSALRVVSGATADGTVVLLCAARPQDASHHDEEAVAAVVVAAGEQTPISDALVSTEYGPDGRVRRLGLELYRKGDDYPVRAAGDSIETAVTEEDGGRRATARLTFRLDGSEGSALYEILEPA